MDKKDLIMHQALMKVLNDGTFELKAREVPKFLEVYTWATNIPHLCSKPKKAKGK